MPVDHFVLLSLLPWSTRSMWIKFMHINTLFDCQMLLSSTYCNSQYEGNASRRLPRAKSLLCVERAHDVRTYPISDLIRCPPLTPQIIIPPTSKHMSQHLGDGQEMPKMLSSLHLPPGWSQGQPQGQPRTRPCSGQSSPKRSRRIQAS